MTEPRALKTVAEESRDQHRYNEIGEQQLQDIENNPKNFVIDDSIFANWQGYTKLLTILSPLQNKAVLDLGCGNGNLSVLLAKKGVRCIGIDIGGWLIAAAQKKAEINEVGCKFVTGNIIEIPFESDTFDAVVGKGVLHHLSILDAKKAVNEAYRVLKKGGVAVFFEPIVDCKAFSSNMHLFPTVQRPSILRRTAYRQWLAALDDRTMTTKELVCAGSDFETIALTPAGLVTRRFAKLMRLITGRPLATKYRSKLVQFDTFLLSYLPPLRYLCNGVMVVYRK